MSFDNMADNLCLTNYESNLKTFKNNRQLWRILCHDCNLYTNSIEAIIIPRFNTDSFWIFAACDKCQTFKSLALKDCYSEKLPSDYLNLPLGKPFMNNIITDKNKK